MQNIIDYIVGLLKEQPPQQAPSRPQVPFDRVPNDQNLDRQNRFTGMFNAPYSPSEQTPQWTHPTRSPLSQDDTYRGYMVNPQETPRSMFTPRPTPQLSQQEVDQIPIERLMMMLRGKNGAVPGIPTY